MKKTHLFRTLLLAGGAAGALTLSARADFAPIPLNPASFNNDPVIEVGAPVAINTAVNATHDGGTNKGGATWYERGYNLAAPATGIPVAGGFVTNAAGDHIYQMAPDYHVNNTIMVGKNAGGGTPLMAGGTFTLTTPAAFSALSFLTSSGNGDTRVGYRINYADTTSEEGTFVALDWFNGAPNVFNASGRVSMDGGVQNVGGSPAGAVFAADIPVGNPGVNITSIELFYAGSGGGSWNTNNNGRAVIFAVSGSLDLVNFTTPIAVTGYTYDPVVEADAPATTGAGRNTGVTGAYALTNHITLTMDGGTNLTGSTWYEKGYYSGLPTTGLPVAGGSLTSAWNSARYTMPASYAGNCAVMLAQHLNTANISFATPAAYGAISLLAGVANGDINMPVVINFEDGSSETNVLFVPDWHNRATPWAYLSGGRVAPNGRFVNNDAGRRTDPFATPYPFYFDWRDITGGLYVPRLHDCVINITNTASAITNISLSFTNGANNRVVSIFAVSGAPVGAVPPVFGVNGSPRPGQPANAVANNIVLVKRWEGTNNVVLSVTNIAGTGPITYQWKKAPRGGGFRDLLFSFDYSTFANVTDGGRISGATTSALVISNALSADSADYLVVASNAGGSVTSHVATVMILSTNQSILVGAPLGDTFTKYTTDPTPGAEGVEKAFDRLQQKWLSFGILNNQLPFVGPVGYTVTPVSGASIVTSMRFFCANDDDNRDPLDYSLEGSNDGSTWSPITGGRLVGTLTLPTGRNSGGAQQLDALNQPVIQVDFPNAVGYNSYRVLVTNTVQSRLTGLMQIGEIELLGALVPNPPVWVRQPDSAVTVFVGASPSFTVAASGNPQPRYQWYRGATPIPGATNATYTFPNAQLADSGSTFSVVATNTFGQLPSSSVTLTVIPAPTETYPAAVLANNPIGYWRLNEVPDDGIGNNGRVARDFRGGHNGYFTNAVIAQPGYNPTADPDTAAQFGVASTLNSFVANINDVDFARPTNAPGATFSVEAWVNGGNQTVDAAIVTKGYNGALAAGTGTGTEQFVLDVIGTPVRNFRFLVRDAAGNGRVALSTKAPFDPVTLQPVWRHVVGVCDQPNGKVYLYVDGLLAGTGDIPTTVGILAQPLPMTIGARKSSGTAEFDNQWAGVVDDVAVYNTALTPSQILAHYYAGQQPPQIALQPTNTVSAENVLVTFYSSAYGPGTLGYQWYQSDGTAPLALLPGQTGSNLVFNTTAAQNGNYYQLVVTNNYGSVTSAVAQLTVFGGAPTILTDLPTSQFFYAGRTMVLSVTVGGTAPFTFQWQKNGSPLANGGRISGANSNVLTITYAGTEDTGNYQLLVSNGQGGPVGSTVDAVTIQAVPQLNAAGAGWTLQGTTAPTMESGSVVLTSGAGSTARSVFYNAPLYVGAFNASFVYHDVGGGGADGATFCIQNDTRGATALGGGGGALAYSGITPSVALAINIYEPNVRGIALAQNGTVPAAGTWTVPTPVAIGSVNPLFVNLRYAAGTLRVTLVESNTANVYNANLAVNIPAVVGGNTAYVGFTAADGGVVATQVISNFTFVPITGLAVEPSGNNVVLSWPASVGGYGLQSNTNVANAAAWQNISPAVNQVGDENQATVPASGNQQYYRLRLSVP